MKETRHLLFFGELPGNFFHGISISNEINLNMLRTAFVVDIIEEYSSISEHNKITVKKLYLFVINNLKIAFKAITKHYSYFYLTFSLSSFGCLKTLATIVIFRLFNRGKVVLHVHRGDFFSRFYKSGFNRIITKFVFKLCYKVLLLSHTQKNIFENKFGRSFHVLPNTVEYEYSPVVKKSKKTNFLFISNYLLDKGIIDLLEVFNSIINKYKGLTLKTFGEFSDKKLKEDILGYNSSEIQIDNAIYGLDKFREISDSDCLILPSWNEGQPIVLLEAMSVGTPVIASKTGLIPELLGDNYPFLIIPNNKKSLEEKIVSFINSDDITGLTENLISRYRKYYSHESHFKCLSEIFI